jgi:hypothetical protein
MLAIHTQHNTDRLALTYLEDLWIARDPVESRAFTVEFVRQFDVPTAQRTKASHGSTSKKIHTFPMPS